MSRGTISLLFICVGYHLVQTAAAVSGCKVSLFVDHLDVSLKDTYTSNTPQVNHDNSMSALRLQPGCCVTLYDLPNYKGQSKKTCNTMTFFQFIKSFGKIWNDRVSSLKLYPDCKVSLFVDHLDVSLKDTYTSNTPQVNHDNSMSALRLQPGCCVTLYDLPNYKGQSKKTCNTMTFAQLLKAFGNSWNDRVSSLKLYPANLRPVPTCSTFMDVGILLDSSGSIRNYYQHEKKFLIALTDSLGISKSGSHAGVITFSKMAVQSIKMRDHYTMNSFTKAVNAIKLMGSITRIDLALKLAKKELFQVRNGARTSTKKLLIILTDGVQSKTRDSVDPTTVANELRNMGVTVMAVGMGSGVNKSELNKITKGHAYTASTFEELVSDKFIRRLTGETCKVSKE